MYSPESEYTSDTDLEQREARIKEREEKLKMREAEIEQGEAALNEKAKKLGLRDKLYSNINVSLRTMDIIIAILAVVLVASIIIGVVQGIG